MKATDHQATTHDPRTEPLPPAAQAARALSTQSGAGR